jgi:hypothetical protein
MWGMIKRAFGGGAPRPKLVRPDAMAVDGLRDLLLANEQTSIWLTHTDQARFSKLGGAADAEGDIAWPKNARGEPMAFVAQLDLADVRAAGGPDWLPEAGALYFFTETQSINPGEGGRVLHRREAIAGGVAPPPPGAQSFKERHVGLEAHPSYPSTDWLNVTERCSDFDAEGEEALEPLTPGRREDGGDHRCAGYPGAIQDGYFALECELAARGESDSIGRLYKDPAAFDALNAEAIQHWRMLLQIDWDDSVGMKWYDNGRIYYFIREDDARAGDFSKVQFQIQFS